MNDESGSGEKEQNVEESGCGQVENSNDDDGEIREARRPLCRVKYLRRIVQRKQRMKMKIAHHAMCGQLVGKQRRSR